LKVLHNRVNKRTRKSNQNRQSQLQKMEYIAELETKVKLLEERNHMLFKEVTDLRRRQTQLLAYCL